MPKKYPIRSEATQYGFNFGDAEITRCFSKPHDGSVLFQIKSQKHLLDVYVTRSGKIRIFESIKEGKLKGEYEWHQLCMKSDNWEYPYPGNKKPDLSLREGRNGK